MRRTDESSKAAEKIAEQRAKLVARLRARLGDECVITQAARLLPYESDAAPLYHQTPPLVLLPLDVAGVIDAIKILREGGMAWSPRGAGTGLAGGAVPRPDGAVLGVARLRNIIEIDPTARRARVEAGVVNLALDAALEPYGFSFGPDPSSQVSCTIGGNVATNAGGAHTLKYGVTSQHLLGVRLALADGTVLELGGAEETMAGYDLLSLVCGSEGTFGTVLEATLRLTPRPEATRTFLAAFDSLPDASRAVAAILQAGIMPAALELIDAAALDALTEAFELSVPAAAAALLIGEVDGLSEAVDPQLAIATDALRESGGRDISVAHSETERAALWAARKKTFGALGRIAPCYLSHDAVIPRTALPQVLSAMATIASRFDLRIVNVFHAGDGNLHPAILFDDADPEEVRRAREAGHEILRLCLSAGGVLTGEHGIGLAKRETMRAVYTAAEIRLMDQLRSIFDPWGLANPDRVLPAPPAARLSTSGEAAENVWTDGDESLSSPHPLSDATLAIGGHIDDREPETFEAEIGERLRRAAEHWETLMPLGGGTLVASPPIGDALALSGADRILHYEPADTTITVEPGVLLSTLESCVARHSQILAWEAPDPEHATIGGVVASGYWSSRTHALGHPKHSLLGFRAVMGSGEVIAHGARVMKNVSGYDLARLMVGSRGTLAVMTRLILRTFPAPQEEALLMIEGEFADLLAIAERLQAMPLGWTQLDLLSGEDANALMIGLDGFSAEVARRKREAERAATEILRIRGSLAQTAIDYHSGTDCQMYRRQAADLLDWAGVPLILRLVVSPRHGITLAARAHELAIAGATHNGERGWSSRLQAHPALGLVRIAFTGFQDEPAMRRLLLSLADAVRELKGYRALDRAPEDFWWGWEPWGFRRGLAERMRRVKLVFDPRGVLAPWMVEGWARGA